MTKEEILQQFGGRFLFDSNKHGIYIDEEELVLLLYEMNEEIKKLQARVEVLEYNVDTSSYYE